MKSLFVGVTLLVTLLTFYSALWHRSEAIERDVESRATAEVADDTISVAADGRHVTLSGVVYSEGAETELLERADGTYGALGPIDGLTYVAERGFVTAIKSEDGISLSGTVPNEETRDSLLSAAQAATAGDVANGLEIAGAAGPWHGEAEFGIGQLAAMTTGTLTAGAGSYVLSGTASEDAAPITAAIAERPDWQSFVSEPDLSNDLTGRIGELETELAQASNALGLEEARSAELEGQLAASEADLNTQKSNFASQLASKTALVSDRDATIDRLNAEMRDLRANFTTERDELTAAAAERDAEIADLRDSLSAEQGELQAERDALQSDLASKVALIADRDGTIERLNAEIGGLKSDFGAEREKAQADIAGLQALVEERDSEIATLNADLEGLRSGLTEEQREASDLSAEVAALQEGFAAERNALQAQLAEKDGTIADRDAQLAEKDGTIADRDAQLAEKDGTIADRDAQLAELNGELDELRNSLAGSQDSLTAQLSERDAALMESVTQIAALSSDVDALNGELDALKAEVATERGEWQNVLASRDARILALEGQVGAGSAVDQCAERADSVLSSSQINFVTGSAEISENSVELLERLTGIALACAGDGVTIEIGGHTDDQGDEADNQALSEERAAAVVSFMESRGVPANGLKAVGYGESQPIADNSTAEGRAVNRRISFSWQAL